MKSLNIIFFAVLLLIATACSSGKTRKDEVRRSRSIVTSVEIETTSASNAYEAIQILRPHLLQRQLSARHNVSLTEGANTKAVVYLDEVRFGDFRSLEQISVFSIKQIEYISPSEATLKFGTGHSGDAFLIRSK